MVIFLSVCHGEKKLRGGGVHRYGASLSGYAPDTNVTLMGRNYLDTLTMTYPQYSIGY